VQKTQKVIDPPVSADAVLSHCLPQQVNDFTATEFDALNEAHNHPHVGQYRRTGQTRFVQQHPSQSHRDRHRRWLADGRAEHRCVAVIGLRGWRRSLRIEIGRRRRGRRNLAALAAGIEPLLLRFPSRRAVVRGTPSARTLPAVVLPAAEWASQVPPTCVAGMREKANPAAHAVNDVALKGGMGLQDRVQRRLILPNKRAGAVVPVPICAKREKLLDAYGKKARLSAIIFIVLYTPSSYLFDANASRGGARFFLRHGQGSAANVRINGPSPIAHLGRSACRVGADPLRVRS